MAFKFPDLMITATFGGLSVQLSMRAGADQRDIGESVTEAPGPLESVREAFMGLAITVRRSRNAPFRDDQAAAPQ